MNSCNGSPDHIDALWAQDEYRQWERDRKADGLDRNPAYDGPMGVLADYGTDVPEAVRLATEAASQSPETIQGWAAANILNLKETVGNMHQENKHLLAVLVEITKAYRKQRNLYAHAAAIVHWVNECPRGTLGPDTEALVEAGAKHHPRTGDGVYLNPPRIAVKPTLPDAITQKAHAAILAAKGEAGE